MTMVALINRMADGLTNLICPAQAQAKEICFSCWSVGVTCSVGAQSGTRIRTYIAALNAPCGSCGYSDGRCTIGPVPW